MDKRRYSGPIIRSNPAGYEFEELSNKIIGTGIAVHKFLGPGFLESIYEEAMVVEFDQRRIKYERQKEVEISYFDVLLGKHRLDLVVENKNYCRN